MQAGSKPPRRGEAGPPPRRWGGNRSASTGTAYGSTDQSTELETTQLPSNRWRKCWRVRGTGSSFHYSGAESYSEEEALSRENKNDDSLCKRQTPAVVSRIQSGRGVVAAKEGSRSAFKRDGPATKPPDQGTRTRWKAKDRKR